MQNIWANVLMILCMCDLALAEAPFAGSLRVAYGRYKLPGGYRCSGRLHEGFDTHIFYPRSLEKGPFPIVSFGHGSGGGSPWELLKSIASLGFVVLAPNGVRDACGHHGGDILEAMENSRIQGNASLHKALGYVDWERRAISGYSFGGDHAMSTAEWAGKEHHLLALAVAHGTNSGDNAHKITLPLFITSEVTDWMYGKGRHHRAFEAAVHASPRVLATAEGAGHMEPFHGGRMNPYMAHFLGCHVAGLQSSCDRIYGYGPDSICLGQPMSACEIIGRTEAPTPLPVGATHFPTTTPTLAPTSAPSTSAPTMAPTSAPSPAPTSAPTTLPLGATFSPTSSPTAAPTIEVKNRGKDCWSKCDEKPGSCDYCGSGLCCRANWETDPAECRAAEVFMNENYHGCVAPSPAQTSAPTTLPPGVTSSPTVAPTLEVQNRGKVCWSACGKKPGSCDYCGSGLCCRANWETDPAECRAAEVFMNENYHGCVAPSLAQTSAPTTLPLNTTFSPTSSPSGTITTSPTTTTTTGTTTTGPTPRPTVAPTPQPTPAKELTPENHPELRMFLELMSLLTSHPTSAPTAAPSEAPTPVPSAAPSEAPTAAPTTSPTRAPTSQPTSFPTLEPTLACTDRSAQCSLWGPLYCSSERYGEFVRAMCRSSCDACIAEDCADEYTACEVWKERGHCESERFAPFLDTYCKKSCDACEVHRRMSFRGAGNEIGMMEVPEFEMPETLLVTNGARLRGSMSPVITV